MGKVRTVSKNTNELLDIYEVISGIWFRVSDVMQNIYGDDCDRMFEKYMAGPLMGLNDAIDQVLLLSIHNETAFLDSTTV